MSIYSPGLGDDDRLVVSPKTACAMLGVGVTKLYELIDTGELESYKDGKMRRITVASIKARVARKLEQSKANPTPHRKQDAADTGTGDAAEPC
jgi:excisionase family DNA binding protein